MKELTNQCLHHIAGGSDDYDDISDAVKSVGRQELGDRKRILLHLED